MTFSSPPLDPIDLNSQQLYLEIPAFDPAQVDSFSTSGAKRRAYLNQVCLAAFLAWLREDRATIAKAWPNQNALPSFWEVVNGTAIVAGNLRLVLIPTESIEIDELRVPQEWIDIPSWAADYYVLVQVDEDYIRVVGHTTHHKIKTIGQYDANDRAYRLDAEDLITDINVIWLSQQFCPNQMLRAEVPVLSPIAQAQANHLLTRLGNSDIVFPRLEVPFVLWGGLLEHGGWRQRLYQQRQGQAAEQFSIQAWFQTGISQLASQLGWQQGEQLQLASPIPGMRSGNNLPTRSCLSRILEINGDSYRLTIVPRQEGDHLIWRFELTHPIPESQAPESQAPESQIPAGFTLRLLTEDLQPFENNADTATETTTSLYAEVMLEPGEGIVWEVEPMPESYDREILRF